MKLSATLLLLAAAALFWIAWRSPEPPAFTPLETPEEQEARPPVPAALTGGPAAGLVRRVLDVEGMCCDGCRRKLHEAVVAVPGVAQAAVSLEDGSASVESSPDVTAERLATALSFGNYVARPRD